MVQKSYSMNSKSNRRKNLIFALVAAVAAIALAGTTVAYLSHSTSEVKNDFTLSDISCQIDETVSGGVKSSVTIQNTGESSAYIRAAVIANSVDENGDIIGPANVTAYLAGTGWSLGSDLYYYYSQPVAPGSSTADLLASPISLEGIQVTILAEAIQSQPASAVQSAWGVSPGSN